MEVHVTSEVQERLSRFTSETGCSQDELVNDAILAHIEELTRTRHMLNSRYDDLKSGEVQGIPVSAAFAQLRDEARAARISRGA